LKIVHTKEESAAVRMCRMQYERATARHHEQKLFLKRIDSGRSHGRNISLKVEHQRATTGNT
jgi:hypothetical protein